MNLIHAVISNLYYKQQKLACKIEMFDLQGKHVISLLLNGFSESSSSTIPLNVMPELYLLKAQKENNLFTQKIVIQ